MSPADHANNLVWMLEAGKSHASVIESAFELGKITVKKLSQKAVEHSFAEPCTRKAAMAALLQLADPKTDPNAVKWSAVYRAVLFVLRMGS